MPNDVSDNKNISNIRVFPIYSAAVSHHLENNRVMKCAGLYYIKLTSCILRSPQSVSVINFNNQTLKNLVSYTHYHMPRLVLYKQKNHHPGECYTMQNKVETSQNISHVIKNTTGRCSLPVHSAMTPKVKTELIKLPNLKHMPTCET